MFTEYSDVVNVKDLSKMLGIGPILAYKLVKTRKITSIKIGREYRIPKKAVINFVLQASEEDLR